jgi:hypothetical protein
MKKTLFIFVLLLSLCFLSNQSYAADDWTGNANLVFGSKSLEKDDWEPLESQREVGFNVDFGKKSWPVNIEIGYLTSSDDDSFLIDLDGNLYDVKVEGSTTELRLGIKKIWMPTYSIRPYISGGLAVIGGKIKSTVSDGFVSGSDSDSHQGVGGYVNGGIFWTLANHFNVGVELGYSSASVKIYDIDTKAGGGHGLFFVGYHW